MPKTARQKVESGIYHIVLRGVNKQTIFYDDEDREVFLNRVKMLTNKNEITLFAFCLMSNHIHLIIKEKKELGKVFMSLLSSYVLWYNKKYNRTGNLFQDRYRSEGIENDKHLLCGIRYVHQNPIKAGIVEKAEDYKWSSHSAYLQEKESFVERKVVLDIIGSVQEYLEFMEQDEEKQFIEDNNRITISDYELSRRINLILKTKNIYDILKCSREEMNEVLDLVKQNIEGASIRQISRVTGLPVSIIRTVK